MKKREVAMFGEGFESIGEFLHDRYGIVAGLSDHVTTWILSNDRILTLYCDTCERYWLSHPIGDDNLSGKIQDFYEVEPLDEDEPPDYMCPMLAYTDRNVPVCEHVDSQILAKGQQALETLGALHKNLIDL